MMKSDYNKLMEKKTISVHAVTIHIYTIIIALLVAVLALVSLKYLHLKLAVHGFTESTMFMNAQQQPVGSVSDYAGILATTVAGYPQGQPLYTQPAALQQYVVALSKQLHRDIVVMDPTRKILADTVAANVGGKYSYDGNGEVNQVLQDGVSRSFVETSVDYPVGMSEVAVVMKDASNHIVGIVLVSSATVGK